MTIRLIPDLLKHGDKELDLGQHQRTRAVVPMPAVAGPDGAETRAWREWLRVVERAGYQSFDNPTSELFSTLAL